MAQAVARFTAKEHHYLAAMAGLASVGREDGQGIGARIEARARTTEVGTSGLDATDDTRRGSLIERLRAVMAA